MRALRWEPIAGTAAVAVLAAALASVLDVAGGPAVQAALLLCASSLAFAADDLVGRVLPTVPVGAAGRLVRRLVLAVPLVAGAGIAVAWLARRADLALPAWPACLAVAVAALATAVTVDRWTDLASPGAAGAGGLVLVVGVAPLALPTVPVDPFAPVGGVPAAVTLLAAGAIVTALRGRR